MDLNEKIERTAAVLAYESWEREMPSVRRKQLIFPNFDSGQFDLNKREMLDEIKSSRRLELVNTHLFPLYEEYEKRVRSWLYEEKHLFEHYSYNDACRYPLLKTRENDKGGNVTSYKVMLPHNLFSDIHDCFLKQIDLELNFIAPSTGYEDFFWYNTDFEYDRKKFLESDSVKGRMTLITRDICHPDNKFVETVPAVMSFICNAWNDMLTKKMDAKYRWSNTTPGKGRYYMNVESLLCCSNDEGLSAMGYLLHAIWNMDQELNDIRTYTEHDFRAIPNHCQSPEEIVSIITARIKDSKAYRDLEKIESLFSYAQYEIMGNGSVHKVCETWNRCAKTKVSSIEELCSVLQSKIDYLECRALQAITIRLLFETARNNFIASF